MVTLEDIPVNAPAAGTGRVASAATPDVTTAAAAPPRVIHVVQNLDKVSVEVWLLRMLGYAANSNVPLDWTFYCTIGEGALDERARALGAKVVHAPARLGDRLAFVEALRSHLRGNRYDVLHCHHDLVSGVYLLASSRLPIKRRIVHVHNADEAIPTPSAIKQRILRAALRRICLTLADRIAANSNYSLDTFLAGRKRRPGIDVVHYLGVDPAPFIGIAPERAAFRRRHGFAEDARIVLFAGRMVPEKNPLFAVDVVAAMRHIDSRVVGLFAGSGSLEGDVRNRAAALGVEPWIRQLGWRDDTPALMAGSDWFILPHPEDPPEGFGIAVVEAQLAGLRLLLSKGILDDPLLPTALYARLALADGPDAWASAAFALLNENPVSHAAVRAAFDQSPFAMNRALAALLALHQ